MLYSWGLRHLFLVAPIAAFILHPAAGPLTALKACIGPGGQPLSATRIASITAR